MCYYYAYANTHYESRLFPTLKDALDAWDEISKDICAFYGFCDETELFIYPVKY